MNFPILFENRAVGEVKTSKKGLYYQFVCQCTPPDSNIYRIIISCGNTEQNLGICIPEEEHFVLTKQVPVKCIHDGEWEFHLRPKEADRCLTIAVSEETPFPMLDKLENSNLLIENGETFITIMDEV